MENQNQVQGPKIDLKNSTGLKNSEDKSVFLNGVILRKVSKFITGTDEDALLPIPVFYDIATGKILKETLPKDLRDEYDDQAV